MSDQDSGGEPLIHPQVATTPRSSLGSGAGLSYSSGSSISPSTSSSGGGSTNSTKIAVSECLGAWLNFLNSLNNLCASGYRLSQTISTLEQLNVVDHQQPAMLPLTSAWDDLARASAVATSTVKSHIVAVLQDYITQPLATLDQESEIFRVKEHNQGIVNEINQTMINLQHQFCVASYDSFAAMVYPPPPVHDPDATFHLVSQQQQQMAAAGKPFQQPPNASGTESSSSRSRTTSPHFPHHQQQHHRALFGSMHSDHHSSTTLEQARGPSPHHDVRGPSPIFLDNVRGPLPNPGHLLTMKAPFYRGSRSPLNFPLFPLAGQRRWSEAAAGEVAASSGSDLDAESQMRRWSMPWEATKTDRNWHQSRHMPISKLAVPPTSVANRSQCTTPDSVWQSSITSQDGLAEAIQLLSCRPATRYHHAGPALVQQHSLGQHPPFIEETNQAENTSSDSSQLQTEAWNQSAGTSKMPNIRFARGEPRDDI